MYPQHEALKSYKQNNAQGSEGADPHTLITMLLQGALDRVATAKGAVINKQLQIKGESISKAMNIVIHLRGCLNMESGGDVAANLDKVYEYIVQCLFHATTGNDPDIFDDIALHLRNIKSGWDEISGNASASS